MKYIRINSIRINSIRIISIMIIILIIASISYKVYEKFQIADCNTLTNCKSCSNSFGCLWCVNSNKCVSDLSNSILCPQESTIADPMACDITSNPIDNSGSTFTGGNCSVNSDCKSCLTSPGCFWCANKQVCSSECIDDPSIYNSIEQCVLQKSISMNTAVFSQTDSIIPVMGLSRNTDGSLTTQSLKIIFDSFSSKGMPIIDSESKQKALTLINSEKNAYNNKFKSYMNTYVDKSIDFVSDGGSLSNAQDIKNHIQDLNDISRYINNFDISTYVEGYQNIDKFDYTLQENRAVNYRIQLLWLGNLIALGTLFYLMK